MATAGEVDRTPVDTAASRPRADRHAPVFPAFLTARPRLPALDGWRALSIVFVLLLHIQPADGFDPEVGRVLRWLPDGGFGVEIFFVISGFLITYLLLLEWNRAGSISIGGFYLRRALRILPAYCAFLVAVTGLCLFTAFGLTGWQVAALLTYTANFDPTMPWTVGHIWSLSVEEQFYLLWPASFLLLLSRPSLSRPSLSGSLSSPMLACLLPILFAPIARLLSYFHLGGPLFATYSFFAHADLLAFGCLMALLCGYHGDRVAMLLERHPRALAAAAIAMMLVPHVLTRLATGGIFTVPFRGTFDGIGISTLLLLSLRHADRPAVRWLDWPAVRRFGTWSYSIYLWQQLFLTPSAVYGFDAPPLPLRLPWNLAGAIGAAVLCHYLIERPFLGLKDRLGRRRHPPIP
ncbi:acyltransferase [Sphingomonas sp.]|uniref:acyltransferase family protein n=1 Tax=Sphingomonas sp. TaxID=28214 RepID=UPI001B15628D|nr:acyltransferase [Sphingomonas sp.]MBO9712296.1 acyltransferase [Sphingomonas sp.]